MATARVKAIEHIAVNNEYDRVLKGTQGTLTGQEQDGAESTVVWDWALHFEGSADGVVVEGKALAVPSRHLEAVG